MTEIDKIVIERLFDAVHSIDSDISVWARYELSRIIDTLTRERVQLVVDKHEDLPF